MNLKSNFFYTVLARVFMSQERKHKRSMIQSIISKKDMSVSRKFHKIYLYVLIRIGKFLRQGSPCILIISSHGDSKFFYKKTLRHAELLMKKGYIVQIEIL